MTRNILTASAGYRCIAYGPGILELAADEWVGINDMLDSAKVMAHALMALLADRTSHSTGKGHAMRLENKMLSSPAVD